MNSSSIWTNFKYRLIKKMIYKIINNYYNRNNKYSSNKSKIIKINNKQKI
jgi:hypothetical protein